MKTSIPINKIIKESNNIRHYGGRKTPTAANNKITNTPNNDKSRVPTTNQFINMKGDQAHTYIKDKHEKTFNFSNKIVENMLITVGSIISIFILKWIYTFYYSFTDPQGGDKVDQIMAQITTLNANKQMILIYLKNKYWKNEVLQAFFISFITILISDELLPRLNKLLVPMGNGWGNKIYSGLVSVIKNITSGEKWYNYIFKFLLVGVIMYFVITEKEPFENQEDLKKKKRKDAEKALNLVNIAESVSHIDPNLSEIIKTTQSISQNYLDSL